MKYPLYIGYVVVLGMVLGYGQYISQSTLDDVGVSLLMEPSQYSNEASAAFVNLQPTLIYNKPATEKIQRFENLLKGREDVKEALVKGKKVYYNYNFTNLDQEVDNEVLFVLGIEEKKKLLIYTITLDRKLGEFPIMNGAVVENSFQRNWRKILLYDQMGSYQVYGFDGEGYKAILESEENVMNFFEISGNAYFTNLNERQVLLIK